MSQNTNQTAADMRRQQVKDLLDIGVDSVLFQHGSRHPIFTRQADRPVSFPTEERQANHGVQININEMPHI